MLSPVIVKCFCDELNDSGNQAGVFIDQSISGDEKQSVASRLKFPVTVFVSQSSSEMPILEFFYPNRKMSLCLHGTLAASFLLLNKNGQSHAQFTTFDGQLLNIERDDNDIFKVKVMVHQVAQPELSFDLASVLLKTDKSNISQNLPLIAASVGSTKLLIPIVSRTVLADLNPDYAAIEKWSIENKINGVYAYNQDASAKIFHARGFNPMTGHNEDAATGTAAAALSSVLRESIVVKQGQALMQPCNSIF